MVVINKNREHEQEERRTCLSPKDKHPYLVKSSLKVHLLSELSGGWRRRLTWAQVFNIGLSNGVKIKAWKRERDGDRETEWVGTRLNWTRQCALKLLLLQVRVKWSEIKGIVKKSLALFVPQDWLEVSLTSVHLDGFILLGRRQTLTLVNFSDPVYGQKAVIYMRYVIYNIVVISS